LAIRLAAAWRSLGCSLVIGDRIHRTESALGQPQIARLPLSPMITLGFRHNGHSVENYLTGPGRSV
jgi:hypothetical protein